MTDNPSPSDNAAISQIPIREAGVSIHDVTFDEAVELILAWAREGSGGYVSTPNIDHLVRAKRDSEFRNLMRGARLRVPDGMGLIYGIAPRRHAVQRTCDRAPVARGGCAQGRC